MSTGAERPSHQLLRHSGSHNRLFSSNPNCKKPARGSLTSAAPTGKKKRGKIGSDSFTIAGKKAPKVALPGQAERSWTLHKALPTGFPTEDLPRCPPRWIPASGGFCHSSGSGQCNHCPPSRLQVGWCHLCTGGNDADPRGAAQRDVPGPESRSRVRLIPPNSLSIHKPTDDAGLMSGITNRGSTSGQSCWIETDCP